MINATLLQKVVGASNDGICVTEQEGSDCILIYVNPAFEEMTGYSASDALYQDCRFLQNGDSHDAAARAEIRAALAAGKPCRQVLRNYRKDGTLFWNELSITPVYHEGDQRTYHIGIQKDVTPQVQALQRVAELEAELALARQQLACLKNDQR
ncbi:PAS domain-containing protein [Pseudomonas sp. NPDC007930]|uniref:PAS domain-containing protein n=1 Tax=Pseudomonas sp. NPDC007930 TaxID=3364417 RepID=UPI0036E2548B